MENVRCLLFLAINLFLVHGFDDVETSTETDASTNTESSATPKIDVQMQIYILSGAFGGVIILLIALVLALALSIARIKDQLRGHQRYQPNEVKNRPTENILSTNVTAGGNDQVTAQQMGYEMYSGRSYPENNNAGMNNDQSVSRAQLQSEIRDSFRGQGRRSDYNLRYQASKPPQLRLKEDVHEQNQDRH